MKATRLNPEYQPIGNYQTELSVEHGTSISAGTGASSAVMTAYRYGKVATVYITITLKSAVSVPVNGNSTDVAVATLPSGWRPPVTSVLMMPYEDGYAVINSSGTVTITRFGSRGSSYTVAAGTEIRMLGTFVLA